MKWLFSLKKKSPPAEDDVKKIGSRMVRLKSVNMFGPYSESESGEYLVVWQDYDSNQGLGGYRHSGNGSFALVRSGKVLLTRECERPRDGKVVNSGVFAILDTLFGDKLGSKLYVYDASGDLLLGYTFSANSYNNSISNDGR